MRRSKGIFFPELVESEDEKIRKELILYFQEEIPQCSIQEHTDKMREFIAWLEKQGKQKPAMIQWTGDNLKELVRFTGKSPKFDEWFKTWEDFENYVHTHDNIFKIFNEDGSHVEIPVGAWIVKTPGGYNVPSKGIFKQKPADKVEPKFEIEKGKWYVCNISRYTDFVVGKAYYCPKNGMLKPNENETARYVAKDCFHLWTIEDAKDGDILMANAPFIFNGNLEGGSGCPGAHCAINTLGKFQIPKCPKHWTGHTTTPATKEQRDLLFTKMHEAGYEWDAEKKELKLLITNGDDFCFELGNCEQKPVWGEEDEHRIKDIAYFLDTAKKHYASTVELDACIDWLKSLKKCVQVQSKQEWSEEDDKRLQRIIDFLWHNRKGDTDTIYQQEQDINWLKSLRPSKWRPTPEQYKALNSVINFAAERPEPYWNDAIFNILKQLRTELKAL